MTAENGLDASQDQIVRIAISIVLQRNLPSARRAATICVMTMITESGIRVLANPNVPESQTLPHEGEGSDHFSVGAYQQQTPMWGSCAACMNPGTSTGLFLDRMVGVANWQTAAMGNVCQVVQDSAFPDRYAANQERAIAIVTSLWSDGDKEMRFIQASDGNETEYFVNENGPHPCHGNEGAVTARMHGIPYVIADKMPTAQIEIGRAVSLRPFAP